MTVLQKLAQFLHRHFLLILIAAYVLAALYPQAGTAMRQLSFAKIPLPDGSSIKATLPVIMLAVLLFNAGVGVKASELGGLFRQPRVLAAGFLANLLLPVVIVLAARSGLALWHSNDELQNLLVGVALIAAMPIAGSSTAWSQNSNGNLSLSLGLVFLSTLLSPFTTPTVLHFFGMLTNGDYSEDLKELAQQGTNAFMGLTVVLPSLLGVAAHFLLGEDRCVRLKPALKLANLTLLLLLNYSNASTSLPQTFRHPDWDFLVLVVTITCSLCAAAFAAGWVLSRVMKTGQSEKASLMFGLGMNNNGTGLVLAGMTLADHPGVMLPMIFYTLAQQIIAAVVDARVFKSALEV